MTNHTEYSSSRRTRTRRANQLWIKDSPPPSEDEDTDSFSTTSSSELSEASESDAADGDEVRYLDQPMFYAFQQGESVWVRREDHWYAGRVLKVIHSQERRELKYDVKFRGNIKALFNPIKGNIKPDTDCVRKLLRELDFL